MNTIQERLQSLLGVEQFVLLIVFCLIDFVIYKIFLRNTIPERHVSLRRQFKEVVFTMIPFGLFWSIQWVITQGRFPELVPFYHYFGIAALLTGALLFVRAMRILVSLYLFVNSLRAGVPILLVNLFTLMISIFIGAWISTSVFGVRWAPLLATSAILSVVLGLALQETLGNLFAGVALQFDKPFEIGDWVEIHTEKQTFVGEVHEITWRATTLFGFFDEIITVPNRMVAQAEVSNFSARKKPIYRGLSLYLDPKAQPEDLKQMFVGVLKDAPGVLQHLEHFIMLRDITEKGAHWRLFYPIVHYSRQYFIVDDILMRVHRELEKRGIETSRLRVETDSLQNN
jgi:small-conductance mechanosensitive channel